MALRSYDGACQIPPTSTPVEGFSHEDSSCKEELSDMVANGRTIYEFSLLEVNRVAVPCAWSKVKGEVREMPDDVIPPQVGVQVLALS